MTVHLDPRVKIRTEDLEHLTALSREMYGGAMAARTAYDQAREMVERLGSSASPRAADWIAQLEELAPPPRAGGGGGFFRRSAPSGPPTLDGISQEMINAAMAMQEAEAAPTARQVAACDQARTRYLEIMERWRGLQARITEGPGSDG